MTNGDAHAQWGEVEVIQAPVYRQPQRIESGKNIVVCADGTGNADVKGRGSNVFKLFEAVDTTSHLYNLNVPRQISFYHEGVGTESTPLARAWDAATGLKVREYTCDLYSEICRAYTPGDRIYLFGFSRGAYTVRALAGLIDTLGILDPSAPKYATNEALSAAVTRCSSYYLRRRTGGIDEVFHTPKPAIEFVGVWDTVDSVGLPFPIVKTLNAIRPFKAIVDELPTSVGYACQALALDEPREAFTPVLFKENGRQNLEQVWFSGAHSDIGGGYPRQGLSLIALHWMLNRAAARGLRFDAPDEQLYDTHQIGSDKVHDPRTGLALYYAWKPRNVAALCRASGVQPHLHISVLDRVAQGIQGYVPINIPPTGAPGAAPASGDVVLNFTDRRDWQLLRPSAIDGVLRKHSASLRGLEAQSRTWIAIGVVSYVLMVVGTIAAVYGAFALLQPRAAATRGAVAACVLAAAWGLAKYTDTTLDRSYSRLWHTIRPDLRASLARVDPTRPPAAVSAPSPGVVTTVARICCP